MIGDTVFIENPFSQYFGNANDEHCTYSAYTNMMGTVIEERIVPPDRMFKGLTVARVKFDYIPEGETSDVAEFISTLI